MDALLSAVHTNMAAINLSPFILEEAYREKQLQYSQFKKLYAENDEPLVGTLAWEVGKFVVGRYGNGNPACMMYATICTMNSAKTLTQILSDPRIGIVVS